MLANKLILKEVCVKLNLKIEMINDVYSLVESFIQSKTHAFSEEVILGTSIYLSGKINEDFKRLRDIINVIFFVKNKYNKLEYYTKLNPNSISEEEKIYYNNLRNDNYTDDKDITLIKTMYNLTIENYYILRDEILKAEQHLLRIINYSFESRSKEALLLLLNYADYLEFSMKEIQLAWDLFNLSYDIFSCKEIEENIFDIVAAVLYSVMGFKTFCEVYGYLLLMFYFRNDSEQDDKHLNRILSLYQNLDEEKVKNYSYSILENFLK